EPTLERLKGHARLLAKYGEERGRERTVPALTSTELEGPQEVRRSSKRGRKWSIASQAPSDTTASLSKPPSSRASAFRPASIERHAREESTRTRGLLRPARANIRTLFP